MANSKIKLVTSFSLVIVIVLLITLPFINKPIHIDDWVFVTGASLACDPNPLNKTIGFFAKTLPLNLITHPPFLFLYLLLIETINPKANHINLHLSYLVFSLLAGLSIFLLARRFTSKNNKTSLIITALFLFSPAFMVSSHSLMSDVAHLAFFLAALTAYIYGLDKDNPFYLMLAAVFSILAMLTAYQALYLLLLLFIYTFINQKSLKNLLKVLIFPLLYLVVWFIYAYLAMGKFHLPLALYWSGLRNSSFSQILANNIIGFSCVIGGALIFPLAFGVILSRTIKEKRIYLLLSGTVIYLLLTRVNNYSLINKLIFSIFFLIGTLAIYAVFVKLAQEIKKNTDRDTIFLCLWFLTFLLAAILFLPQGISRYLLPAILPLIILTFKDFKKLKTRLKTNSFLFFMLASTLTVGALASLADLNQAQANKAIAEKIDQKFSGQKIYFLGEFGFRYYMEKLGYKYLFSNNHTLEKDAILVETENYLKGDISPKLKPSLEQIDQISFYNNLPIILMSKRAKADFYSSANGYGFLPYSFSEKKDIIETFKIYRFHNATIHVKPPLHEISNNLEFISYEIDTY